MFCMIVVTDCLHWWHDRIVHVTSCSSCCRSVQYHTSFVYNTLQHVWVRNALCWNTIWCSVIPWLPCSNSQIRGRYVCIWNHISLFWVWDLHCDQTYCASSLFLNSYVTRLGCLGVSFAGYFPFLCSCAWTQCNVHLLLNTTICGT